MALLAGPPAAEPLVPHNPEARDGVYLVNKLALNLV
jgi:hypothetical protein